MLQGCSKKRPDIYFELERHCVIVEVDEHQHNAYEDSCECSRINEIVNGIGGKSFLTSDLPTQGSGLGQKPPNAVLASTSSLCKPGTEECSPAGGVSTNCAKYAQHAPAANFDFLR